MHRFHYKFNFHSNFVNVISINNCLLSFYLNSISCSPHKTYPVSILLKYNPTNEWISEGWDQNSQNHPPNYESKCTYNQYSTIISKNIMKEFYKNYTLSPIVFIREKSLSNSEMIVKDYFKRNESAYLTGYDSPGGYLQLEGNAFCRDLHKIKENIPFNQDELNLASTLRIIFRVSLS